MVDFLPEEQCGFYANQGTASMILQQIQEKCIVQNEPFYMVFVHFTKAFDTVNKEVL